MYWRAFQSDLDIFQSILWLWNHTMCLRCFALTCKLKWDLDYNCSFIQRLPPRNRSSCNLNIISDTRLPLLPEYKDTEWAHPGAGSTLWKPILNLYNTVWQPRLNPYSNCKKTDTDIFPFGPHWILQDKCSDKNISCHLRKLSWTHSWQGRFNPNRHELIHKKKNPVCHYLSNCEHNIFISYHPDSWNQDDICNRYPFTASAIWWKGIQWYDLHERHMMHALTFTSFIGARYSR